MKKPLLFLGIISCFPNFYYPDDSIDRKLKLWSVKSYEVKGIYQITFQMVKFINYFVGINKAGDNEAVS